MNAILCVTVASLSSPLPMPSGSVEEAASVRAREAYFAMLERQSLIINDGPADGFGEGTAFPTRSVTTGDGREEFRYAGHWPFEGFVPRPSGFPVPRLARPMATLEWRWRSGVPVESYAAGETMALRRCRSAFSDRRAGRDQGAEDWTPPHPDASPAVRDARTIWASSWIDAYELAPGGPLLLVGFEGVPAKLSISVDGVGPLGEWRVEGEPLSADQLVTGSAMAGMTLHIADLDRNGSRDAILATHVCGTGGLAACSHEIRIVLTDAPAGRATITSLEGLGFDLIDLERNGRAELLLRHHGRCERCTDGKPHHFDITELLGFRELGVVDLRDVHEFRSGTFVGRFPAFEWMAFDERNRFRELLTPGDRDRMAPRRFPPYR